MITSDFCVIGGGIVGLATAYRLSKNFPDKTILVLEKENRLAEHKQAGTREFYTREFITSRVHQKQKIAGKVNWQWKISARNTESIMNSVAK